MQKSPASWATSVTARMAALAGVAAVPAVKTISDDSGKVEGSHATAPTVGSGVPIERSLRMMFTPSRRKAESRFWRTGSMLQEASRMVGRTGRSRSVRQQTWRSMSSLSPCKRDSASVLLAEGPLNSLRSLNQSRGSQVTRPEGKRVAG